MKHIPLILTLLLLPLTAWAQNCNVNTQNVVTSYTPVLSDANNCVAMNNSVANTVSIPPNASVPFPVRTTLTIQNVNTGLTTVQGLAGVTILLPWTGSVLPSLRQYTQMTLQKIATDTWQVITSTNAIFSSIVLPSPNPTTGLISNGTGSVTLQLSDSGDFFGVGSVNPIWSFRSSGAAPGSFGYITAVNNISSGPQLGVGPSTATNVAGCAGSGGYALQPVTGPCEYLDTGTNYPLIIGINFTTADFYKGDNTEVIRAVGPTSIKYLDALNASGTTVTTTLGDSVTATSVTNIRGGSAANTQANGVPILTGYSATSTSLGGSALTAGTCSTGTVTVTGAAVGMDAHATPSTYPGDGSTWAAYVSAANTVTLKVCAIVALTPVASVYNVRVTQ